MAENENAVFYGVQTTELSDRKLEKFTFLKNLSRIQPLKFWIVAYILSFVVYILADALLQLYMQYIGVELIKFNKAILLINTLFFPLTIILFSKIGSKMEKLSKALYVLVFPSAKVREHLKNPLFILIVFILKLILFYLLWLHSYIVGIIGLLLMLNDIKKLSK